MKNFLFDLRHSARSLWRKPVHGGPVIASLVVGIGLNAAIFTVIDATFLHPLPIPDLDRLVILYQTVTGNAQPRTFSCFSFPEVRLYRREMRTLRELAAYQRLYMSLSAGVEAERVWGGLVSSNYFEVLGLTPAHGRFFSPAEDLTPGSHPVVVLAHHAWTRLFNGAPDSVGRQVSINGQPFTVVGVAPAGLKGVEIHASLDFWIPTMMYQQVAPNPEWFDHPDVSILQLVGRMETGATLDRVNAELATVGPVVAQAVGKAPLELATRALPFVAGTLAPRHRPRYEGYGRNLVLAVGLVLLISCINVSNLLLVRGFDRSRELATRLALGSPRGRLVRQLLTENLLLFLVGGALALPAAHLFTRILWSFRPPELASAAIDLSLHGRVLTFLLLVTLTTGLATGLVPALRATRPDLMADLKNATARPVVRLRRWTPLKLVVVPQLALALVALIASGLLLRNLVSVSRIDLGFDADRLLVLTVSPGSQGYDEPRARAYYDQVLERTRSIPGVVSAALAYDRLLRGAVIQRQVYPEGEDVPPEGDNRPFQLTTVVSPGFFDAVGIEILQGDGFADSYPPGAPLAVVVNESMARSLWPGESALGKRFSYDYPTEPKMTVVAVVEDVKYRTVHEDPLFIAYQPLSQAYVPYATLHVRTAGDPATVLSTVRESVRRIDPTLPLADVATMSTFVRDALWFERAVTVLVSVFGAIALILASVGVYGVMRYAVRRRRREFGIRVALGAGQRDIQRIILADSALVATLGIALGVGLSLLLSPAIKSQLYDLASVDPATYLGQSAVLFAVTLLGGYLPARRASRTNAVDSLRQE